jgi:hypothetical protein
VEELAPYGVESASRELPLNMPSGGTTGADEIRELLVVRPNGGSNRLISALQAASVIPNPIASSFAGSV